MDPKQESFSTSDDDEDNDVAAVAALGLGDAAAAVAGLLLGLPLLGGDGAQEPPPVQLRPEVPLLIGRSVRTSRRGA